MVCVVFVWYFGLLVAEYFGFPVSDVCVLVCLCCDLIVCLLYVFVDLFLLYRGFLCFLIVLVFPLGVCMVVFVVGFVTGLV